MPKDFDTIDVPFPERGAPQLVKGGALERPAEREAVPSGEEAPRMTRMVQVAMAGDVTEAEELQTILR